MRKFKILKFVTRTLTPRNWRCHKRRIFFEKLFEDLKVVRDEKNKVVSGYIEFTDESYTDACHELAAQVPFYPFDQRSFICIGEFFGVNYPQTLYNELQVRIVRTCDLWRLFSGYGTYDVTVCGFNNHRNAINQKYTKTVKLL